MLTYSMEQILYQRNDSYKAKLTAIIEDIYSDIDSGKIKSNPDLILKTSYPDKIISLLKDRFNLTFVMDESISEYIPAAVLPFSNNILIGKTSTNAFSPNSLSKLFGFAGIYRRINEMQKEQESIFRKIDGKKGFVDYKNARVGGYLAEAKSFLIINFFYLRDKGLTPAGAAGVITHEVGHVFNGLAEHYRMSTVNSAISDVINELNNNKPDVAHYKFLKHFGAEEVAKAKLSKNSEITDFYTPLVSTYVSNMSNMFINSSYEKTDYEYLSDSFAARLGFGSDLVESLVKFHGTTANSVIGGPIVFMAIILIDMVVLASVLLVSGLIGVAIFATCMILISGSDRKDMTYDVNADRYNRIRSTLITVLKDKNIPRETGEDILKQLDYIDDVIKRTVDMRDLFERVADVIRPDAYTVAKYVKTQQVIENSLNNILYQKSAQLRFS